MKGKQLQSIVVLTACLALLIAGCATGPSKPAYQGGAVGAGVGAVAGALIDSDNSWRGGVIGGALGAVLGGALGEISHRARRQAVHTGQPVAYQNQSGTQKVVVHPTGQKGKCQVVKESYYEKGQLVKVTEREVCP